MGVSGNPGRISEISTGPDRSPHSAAEAFIGEALLNFRPTDHSYTYVELALEGLLHSNF